MSPTRIQAITGVEAIIGYRFINDDFLWEALQSPGAGPAKASNNPGARYFPEGNKRLAVYGDALLQCIVIEKWVWENVSREEASNRRQTLTTNRYLAAQFERLGLDRFLYTQHTVTDLSENLRAAAMEAILGAIGMDARHDHAPVKAVMDRLGLLRMPRAINV